jgi:two-component system, chemotaxis family, protein-glutamate methylesterase/glutaminase
MKRFTVRSGEFGKADTAPIGYAMVVVGTSLGGLDALRTLVGGLPPEFDIPMTIIQHRHRDSDAILARILQNLTTLRVCEVEDKQPVETGSVYLAPADYHLLVERDHFALSVEAPVRYSRPSIDVAMTSAADAFEHRVVGVILTGSNADGARGLRRIADRGGLAVVQDPTSAEAAEMPEAAIRSVPTARVFSMERIAAFLGALPRRHARSQRGA